MSTSLTSLSVSQLAQGLSAGQFSSVEITQAFLERSHQLNDQLNAYITICDEQALEQARQADQKIANGATHPLTGIPIAAKDIFCTQGILTSCGSRMLENFISPYNATAIEQLYTVGMTLLGKTNMDEFAMGSSNENSYFGSCYNPWDTSRVPGGSSGGSAVVVAAQMAPVSIGTDTGGSIRQPAAFCGVTGIKPTYGRVSRYGMVAFASSLDQGGVFGHTAEDCAVVLQAISGLDLKDSTSADVEVGHFLQPLDFNLDAKKGANKGIKIGYPKEWMNAELNSDIKHAIMRALKQFEDMGAIVEEVSLPHTQESIASYYIIAMSEASTNLSRYDGVRYGYRCENPQSIEDLYMRSRGEGFGDEVKKRILTGTYCLSTGYYDDYYLKAQKVRRLVTNDYMDIFKQYDFIVGPVTPSTAFGLGQIKDSAQMFLEDIYTLSLNLTGRPGMSIPVGFDQQGLPIGLQLIADNWQEAKLLSLAKYYQDQTDWHLKTPSV